MKLIEKLNEKIDSLLEAHEYLKAENSMLRDELQVTKNRLQEQSELSYQPHSDINESELEAIIEKLEAALETH